MGEHPKVVWRQEVDAGADAFEEQNDKLRNQVEKISQHVEQKKAQWLRDGRFEERGMLRKHEEQAAEDEEDWGAEDAAFDFVDSDLDDSSSEEDKEATDGSGTDPEEQGSPGSGGQL